MRKKEEKSKVTTGKRRDDSTIRNMDRQLTSGLDNNVRVSIQVYT